MALREDEPLPLSPATDCDCLAAAHDWLMNLARVFVDTYRGDAPSLIRVRRML